jgi:hypothetical protein
MRLDKTDKSGHAAQVICPSGNQSHRGRAQPHRRSRIADGSPLSRLPAKLLEWQRVHDLRIE